MNSVKDTLALFFVKCILFIPFEVLAGEVQFLITDFIFTRLIKRIEQFFAFQFFQNIDYSSDTASMFILMVLLFLGSMFTVVLTRIVKVDVSKWEVVLKRIITYYLVFVLLTYGLDKLFLKQFYHPAPNILYSNFGDLTKDILFWSTMGASPIYSIALGIIEILTALLILFGRTRVFGLFLAVIVFFQIVLINFSFDISVKMMSLLLTGMVIFLLSPDLVAILNFFVWRKETQLVDRLPQVVFSKKRIDVFVKLMVIGFFLFQLGNRHLILHFSTSVDKINAPIVGAYEIESMSVGGDTLEITEFPWKRVFVHNDGFLIFEDHHERMTDYFFETNGLNGELTLHGYEGETIDLVYHQDPGTSRLQLKFTNAAHWKLEAKQLRTEELSLFSSKNHFFVDTYKSR